MKRALDPFLPVLGVFGLIALWYLAVWKQIVDPVLLPSPIDTFRAMYKGMAGGRLGFDFLMTVERTVLSTVIAAAIAIPLGIFLGASERLYRSLEFVIDFFRSTPASAMFPLFLVLFGVGNETKISVAAFGAALVILFNVSYGVMNARKTRLLAARQLPPNPTVHRTAAAESDCGIYVTVAPRPVTYLFGSRGQTDGGSRR